DGAQRVVERPLAKMIDADRFCRGGHHRRVRCELSRVTMLTVYTLQPKEQYLMSKFLHVSLRSRGRDQTSEWYQKNLGFEERRRGTTGIGTQTAILALPGNETYIEVSDRANLGHEFDI